MRIANYTIIKETADLLLIRDIGPHDKYLTVTNAAEQIVTELAPRLDSRRLEYIDSEGERAQILVSDGRFAGFAPVSATVDVAGMLETDCHTAAKGSSRMWRVTVRTFLGAKRGEFLVENDKLKETVEGIATEFFTYDCWPERQ